MNHFIVIHKPEPPLGELKEFMLNYVIGDEGEPHSFTGKAEIANLAAKNGVIYVIGYRDIKESSERIYELGYMFVSTKNTIAPKNAEYHYRWQFKNTAAKEAQGLYFDAPVVISSKAIIDKLVEDKFMKEISPAIALELDQIFTDNCAKSF